MDDPRKALIYRSIMYLSPTEKKQRKIWQEKLRVKRIIDERAVGAILRGEPDPELRGGEVEGLSRDEIEMELKRRGDL